MDAPLLSKTLGGRFKITGHIGEGAMASVFRGIDLKRGDGNEVAVKIMHPHLASDRTFTARFKREAEAASMVKHPNSVAIIDVGEEQGVHYIVMELCSGRDLRETLKIERRLSEPRALRIVMTICDALHVAHQLGVVHRDLKPENVMILHDPVKGTDLVKVLDFGIAKLVDAQPKVRVNGTDSDPPPALTQFGVVVGTPQYMSPEQCRGQPLDGRSDVYTCGILLYQLVTGALPFNSESPFEVAGKQAFEPPPAPHTFYPQIDRELEAIILKTLSKAAADRPQSALELKETLQRWLDAHGSAPKGVPAPNGSGSSAEPPDLGALVSTANMNPAPPDARAGAPRPPPRPLPPPPPNRAKDAAPPPSPSQPGGVAPGPPGPPPARPVAPPAAGSPPAQPGRPDLRALQQTLPLNDPTAKSVKAAVAEYLAQNPVKPPDPMEARARSSLGGPFQPTGPGPGALEPAPFDQGPLGTVVAMEAVQEPPRQRPAAGVAPQIPPPDQAFGPGGAGGYPLAPPALELNAQPPAPAPLAQDALVHDNHQPPMVAPPAVDGAALSRDARPPAELPRQGWGLFGVLMVLLSLAAGVGLGFGLYRWAPF